MKKILFRIFLLGSFFVFNRAAIPQQLNMTLNLNPYPSPYYSDWQRNPASIGFVTVFNNINYSGRTVFSIRIIQENEGLIFEGKSVPIYIHSVPVQTILGSYIADFDEVNLPSDKFKGIAIQTGRLGQGNFTLCLQIFDQITDQPLSDEVCGNFFINYPTPPRLISPIENDTLEAAIYYPNFQWTPVTIPFGQKVRYVFTLVEVLEGQTKYQAIESNRPLYENKFLMTNSLTYPAEALQLEGDKTYAWQVQALDEYGLPLTQNDGKSEVFTFYKRKGEVFYKPPKKVMDLLPIVPFDKAIAYNKKPVFKFRIKPEEFPNVIYELVVAKKVFKDDDENFANAVIYNKIIKGSDSKLTPEKELPLELNSNYIWRIVAFDTVENEIIQSSEIRSFAYKSIPKLEAPYTQISGSMEFIYADPQAVQIFPPVVKKKNLKLVLKYSLKVNDKRPLNNPKFDFVPETRKGWILLPDSLAKNFGNDLNKTISVCQTDSSGNFVFKFVAFDTTKLIQKNYNLVFYAPDKDSIIYSGDVYRTARIVVDDPYFLSPDEDIIFDLFKENEIGKITSQVRVYTLKLSLKEAPLIQKTFYTGRALDSVAVYLLRKTVPYNLPFDKCLPFADEKDSLINMKVVAKRMSDAKGEAEFHLLSLNINPIDEFFLYAESYSDGKHYHKSELISLRFNYSSYDGGRFYYTKKNLFSNEIIRIDSKFESLPSKFIVPKDNSVFNIEYAHPIVYSNLYLYPRLPKIIGYCVDGEEPTKIVKNVKATLIRLNPWEIELEKYSDLNGVFVFDNLEIKLDTVYPFIPIYPKRKVIVEAPGYYPLVIDIYGKQPNGVLNYGEIINLKSLVLNRIPKAKAAIIDEDGMGVQAFVRVGDGPYEFLNPGLQKFNNKFYYDSVYAVLNSPSLGKQKIIFIPRAKKNSYTIDTLEAIYSTYNNDFGEIKIVKKKHKISISVLTDDSLNTRSVVGAKVILYNGAEKLERMSDEQGEAVFVFDSYQERFKVEIMPPLHLNLEKYIGTIVNAPSKLVEYYKIKLKPAATLYGKVLDEEGKPVDSALVFADLGKTEYYTSALTKEDGTFVISGLPFNSKFSLYASKISKDTTIIGEIREFELNPENTPFPIVTLRVKYSDKIFLPKLFNLPVYLYELEEIDTSTYKISGMFKDFPSNELFSSKENETFLRFKDFYIKKSNQRKKDKLNYFYGLPKDSVLIFENYETTVLYKNFLPVKIFDDKPLRLEKIKGGIYGLKGKAAVNVGNASSMEALEDMQEFFLASADSLGIYMEIFTITNFEIYPDILTKRFYVVNENGDDIKFKFLNFEARADKYTSRLFDNKLVLDLYAKINLRNILEATSEIRIGKLNVKLNENSPPDSEEGFAMKINKFKIDIDKWIVENNFLIAYDADLKFNSTLKFNKLYFNSFGIGPVKFADKGSSILSAHPIKASGVCSFDFLEDNSISFASFAQNENSFAISIDNLPGMKKDSKFLFSSFLINSNSNFDYLILNPGLNSTIDLYEIGKIRLTKSDKVYANDDSLIIPSLNFDIPNFGTLAKAKYESESGNRAKLIVKDFIVDANIIGDVNFSSSSIDGNSATLNEKGAEIKGKLYLKNEFNFYSNLYKKNDSVFIEVKPIKVNDTVFVEQKLNIYESRFYLNNIYAKTKSSNGRWSPIFLSGYLSGINESDSSYIKLYFSIDEKLAAYDQKLAFKNIPLYIGWIDVLFEYEKNRLIGYTDAILDFNGMSYNGMLELQIDSIGWFFGGFSDFYVPSVKDVIGGSFFGVYPTVSLKLKSLSERFLSYKTLINDFALSVDGIYFVGKRRFEMKTPKIELNFNYATTKLLFEHSSDLYFYSSFLTPQRFYYLKLKNYVNQYFDFQNIAFMKYKAFRAYEGDFVANYDRFKQKFEFEGCLSLPFEFEIKQTLRKSAEEILDYQFVFDKNYPMNRVDLKMNVNVYHKKNKGVQIKEGICK